MNNFTKGGTRSCLYSHTGIFIEKGDILKIEAQEVGHLLAEVQFGRLDFRTFENELLRIANTIQIRSGKTVETITIDHLYKKGFNLK